MATVPRQWAALRAARTTEDMRNALEELAVRCRHTDDGGDGTALLAPPSDARSMQPLLSALRHPETAIAAAVVLHALCGRSDAAPYLVRGGALGPLCDAASYTANYSDAQKLRGWATAALAALARSVCGGSGQGGGGGGSTAALRQKLPEVCLPTLIGGLQPSAPSECRAWAADAVATLIRHDAGASALAIRLNLVPALSHILAAAADGAGATAPSSSGGDAASAAAARSALAALCAVVRLAVGRARVLHGGALDELKQANRQAQSSGMRSHTSHHPHIVPSSPTSSIVHAAVQLLLRPSIAPTAAHFLRKLCSAGGPEAANAVLGSAALPAALPLLLAADAPSADSEDGDFEGGDLQQEHPAAPIRATLVAVTSMLLSTPTPATGASSSAASSSSVVSGGPASSKPAADADPAALDALRHAATSVLTRAAGSSAASHTSACRVLKQLLSAIEAEPLPRPRAAAKSVMAPAKSAEASAEAGGRPPVTYLTSKARVWESNDDESDARGPRAAALEAVVSAPAPAAQPSSSSRLIDGPSSFSSAASRPNEARHVANIYSSLRDAAVGWDGADSLAAHWSRANAGNLPSPRRLRTMETSTASATGADSGSHSPGPAVRTAADLPLPNVAHAGLDPATTSAAQLAAAAAARRTEKRVQEERRATLERTLLAKALEGCEARAAAAAEDAAESRAMVREAEARCDLMGRASREAERRANNAESAQRLAERGVDAAEERSAAAERVAAAARTKAERAKEEAAAGAEAATKRAVKEAVATAVAEADGRKAAAVAAARAEAKAEMTAARAEWERQATAKVEAAVEACEERHRLEVNAERERRVDLEAALEAAEARAAETEGKLAALAERSRAKDAEEEATRRADAAKEVMAEMAAAELDALRSHLEAECAAKVARAEELRREAEAKSHGQVREARKAAEAACRSAADAHARARASELAREDAAAEHSRLLGYLTEELETTRSLLVSAAACAEAYEAEAREPSVDVSSIFRSNGVLLVDKVDVFRPDASAAASTEADDLTTASRVQLPPTPLPTHLRRNPAESAPRSAAPHTAPATAPKPSTAPPSLTPSSGLSALSEAPTQLGGPSPAGEGSDMVSPALHSGGDKERPHGPLLSPVLSRLGGNFGTSSPTLPSQASSSASTEDTKAAASKEDVKNVASPILATPAAATPDNEQEAQPNRGPLIRDISGWLPTAGPLTTGSEHVATPSADGEAKSPLALAAVPPTPAWLREAGNLLWQGPSPSGAADALAAAADKAAAEGQYASPAAAVETSHHEERGRKLVRSPTSAFSMPEGKKMVRDAQKRLMSRVLHTDTTMVRKQLEQLRATSEVLNQQGGQ